MLNFVKIGKIRGEGGVKKLSNGASHLKKNCYPYIDGYICEMAQLNTSIYLDFDILIVNNQS